MFVLSRDVSAAKRVIATLLATAIVLWASGAFGSVARAANLTNVSDTLSDSSLGADSNHTIYFEVPGGVAAGTGVITIDFPDTFDFTGIDVADIDMAVGATDQDITGADWNTVVSTATSSVTFYSNAGSIAANGSTTILIGTNATGGTDQINNPDVADDANVSNTITGNESYEIDISAGADSGHTRVVVLDTVLVTATVDTVFNFVVNGLGTGVDVNGTTTDITTSSTTIPFGTLTAYTKVTAAQNLTVETNAINGFVVTLQSDGAFESSTGADIDSFEDGGDTNTPTTWSSPSVGLNIAQEDTWGHWGMTTEDQDTDGMRDGDEFAAGEFIGVSTTPRQIFAHNGPADAVTTSIGSTTVGFQVEISPLQEAADDYSTVLTYIATPTF